jgi:hypothetical protein
VETAKKSLLLKNIQLKDNYYRETGIIAIFIMVKTRKKRYCLDVSWMPYPLKKSIRSNIVRRPMVFPIMCNDGHMALCGLATELYQHKPETGRVIPTC